MHIYIYIYIYTYTHTTSGMNDDEPGLRNAWCGGTQQRTNGVNSNGVTAKVLFLKSVKHKVLLQ